MNKELSANATLPHYRIVSKIGARGMGPPTVILNLGGGIEALGKGL